MQFDSLSAALEMGGHGAYVWPIYAVAILVVAVLLIGPRRRSARILKQLQAEHRRNQRARGGQ